MNEVSHSDRWQALRALTTALQQLGAAKAVLSKRDLDREAFGRMLIALRSASP